MENVDEKVRINLVVPNLIHEQGKERSKEVFGAVNFSAYVSYLINKDVKESKEK